MEKVRQMKEAVFAQLFALICMAGLVPHAFQYQDPSLDLQEGGNQVFFTYVDSAPGTMPGT